MTPSAIRALGNRNNSASETSKGTVTIRNRLSSLRCRFNRFILALNQPLEPLSTLHASAAPPRLCPSGPGKQQPLGHGPEGQRRHPRGQAEPPPHGHAVTAVPQHPPGAALTGAEGGLPPARRGPKPLTGLRGVPSERCPGPSRARLQLPGSGGELGAPRSPARGAEAGPGPQLPALTSAPLSRRRPPPSAARRRHPPALPGRGRKWALGNQGARSGSGLPAMPRPLAPPSFPYATPPFPLGPAPAPAGGWPLKGQQRGGRAQSSASCPAHPPGPGFGAQRCSWGARSKAGGVQSTAPASSAPSTREGAPGLPGAARGVWGFPVILPSTFFKTLKKKFRGKEGPALFGLHLPLWRCFSTPKCSCAAATRLVTQRSLSPTAARWVFYPAQTLAARGKQWQLCSGVNHHWF